jgi:predicted MFS family arabinose efflux permease
MTRKNAIRLGAGIVALVSVTAEGHWKNARGSIQMAMYTALTVGLVLVGFWSDRRRPRFRIAVCSVLVVHCALLFAIKGIFPFHTILTIYPLIIIEATALAALLLKILEYGKTGDDI